jgi:hypothetical protein
VTAPVPGLRELMRAGVRRSVATEYRRLLAAGVRREAALLLAEGRSATRGRTTPGLLQTLSVNVPRKWCLGCDRGFHPASLARHRRAHAAA